MKIYFSFLLIGLLSSAGLAQDITQDERSTQLEDVRMTAYTHTESDHIVYGRKNAIGTRLRLDKNYSSAAADWSRFPLGTKFKMDGKETTYVIDDYGSALVGKDTIDIYHPSKRAMNKWGVRYVDIEIIEFGDYEKSREILEERKGWRHCRKMLASINKMRDPLPQPGVPMTPAEIEPKMMLANVEPTPAPIVPQPEPAKKAAAPAPVPQPEPLKGMAPTPDPEVFLASLDAAVVPEPESAIAPEPEIQVEPTIELASYTPAPRSVTFREVRPLSHDEVRERVVYRKRSFTPISTL
ncbi:MAG: 3D domain-containing protein [Verrucomicrobiales bacterium]